MITTAKTIISLSALLSAGFVGAVDWIKAPAQAPSAVTKVLDRHPDLAGAGAPRLATVPASLGTVSTQKGDRLQGAALCAVQTWPYIADGCQTSGEDKAVRRATRTIAIERRAGQNTTVLLRLPERVARN